MTPDNSFSLMKQELMITKTFEGKAGLQEGRCVCTELASCMGRSTLKNHSVFIVGDIGAIECIA